VTLDSRADDHAVSVVIVTYQSEQYIGSVLDALLDDANAPDEVIVIDNGSTDTTREIVARYDVQLVALDDNLGFAEGCHKGAEAAQNETVIFLGHDTIPRPGWLAPLVDAVRDPDVGAAMATIEDADNPGTFNTSGGHLTYYGIAWVSDLGEPIPENAREVIDVAFPSGAAMAIRKETWREFGVPAVVHHAAGYPANSTCFDGGHHAGDGCEPVEATPPADRARWGCVGGRFDVDRFS
jgi:GT2 family glycosyltransferase